MLEGGILEAGFEPTLIKNSLNLSVITILSVIDVLFILKVLETFSGKTLDFLIISFIIFQVVLILFSHF